MKYLFVLFILLFLTNCSFDNKTGIWKDENNVTQKDDEIFKQFKDISLSQREFNKIIVLDKKYKFKQSKPAVNKEWVDIYFSKNNKFNNFSYNNSNSLIFKSNKITRNQSNKFILYEKNNLIISDKKGNIIIFSVDKNENIGKFNFYKKKYKKINKILNIVVEKNIIYASDNLGYLYAYDYSIDKILWAKNYKIPFRSNIKIFQEKILLSNQNNTFFFINKLDGNILRTIPTEDSAIKNKFISNIAVYKNNVVFLNTYGSLYSLNGDNMRINWFINLNQSLDINPSNLFISNQLVITENKIFVPTNNNLHILDLISGSSIFKKNFTSILKPLIFDNVMYAIDNNYLIAMEVEKGQILFSYDINQKISEYLKIEKRKAKIKNLMFANNKVFIFLSNSYVLQFNRNGTLHSINRLPEKINSNPIFAENSIIFLNKKNKISIIN